MTSRERAEWIIEKCWSPPYPTLIEAFAREIDLAVAEEHAMRIEEKELDAARAALQQTEKEQGNG